ncbi:metal-dependent protein hydrolase [Kipferlia bialata]|uniref:Metal-dependent protein hydrolase n=1 Tax=Kipferlia bialata TaxID=797122 RepID=A0A9K3CPB8_9EUKA|nr:metal-dependent protein hydrolase [Kipferlia bialata]|eukprot:g570.t1
MKTCNETMPGYDIKLSAGMVYKHYGHQIIDILCAYMDTPVTLTETQREWVYQTVYKGYVMACDGQDTGEAKVVNADGTEDGLTVRYSDSTGMGSTIANLRPQWNESFSFDSRFPEAMATAGAHFKAHVTRVVKHRLPAYDIVKTAMDNRRTTLPWGEGRVLVIDTGVPADRMVYEMEEEKGLVLYIVMPRSDGTWGVKAVNREGSMALRKPLPSAWGGLRHQDLDKATGLTGCVFVHKALFTGAASDRQTALDMARMAYENME